MLTEPLRPQRKLDYRNQLLAELTRRKMLNSRYSLRAFALALGVSAPFLSNLFRGKKNLSLEMAVQFSEKLGFSRSETAQFCKLVQLGQPHSNHVRAILSGDSPDAGYQPAFFPIDLEAFQAVSDWYHYAILLLCECSDFQESHSWIAKRLGITSSEAKAGLERLKKLGLFRRDQRGRLIRTQDFIATPSNEPSRALRNFHSQMIEKAGRALENQPIEQRDITGITVAISADKLPQAKEEIKKFRRRMAKLMESGRPTAVYQLNIQFFDLTETKIRGAV